MSSSLFETVSPNNTQQPLSHPSFNIASTGKTPLLYYSQEDGQLYLLPQYAGYFSHLNQLLQTLKYRMAEDWNE